MADKKIREEASGPGFHLLVHHFLVEVFWFIRCFWGIPMRVTKSVVFIPKGCQYDGTERGFAS